MRTHPRATIRSEVMPMPKKRNKGTATAHMVVADVEAVVLRAVAGAGEQVEVCIKAKDADLVLRLVSRRGRSLRVVNLRKADKRRAGRTVIPMPQRDEDGGPPELTKLLSW